MIYTEDDIKKDLLKTNVKEFYMKYLLRADNWYFERILNIDEKDIIHAVDDFKMLGEDGLYYPDLYLPEETEYPIGKYGMMRRTYLKEHRKGMYLELVLAGKLNEHLHQIDEECHQMMDRLVEQMKEQQGVTEELKMQDQMAWVGKMNNIIACAEEIVVREVVYV